jgi:predicted Zn-dependent protease
VLTNIVKEKPMQKRMFVIFLLLFAAVTLAAQSKKLRPGFNLFSKEQDVQLGKESAAEVEKKMKVIDSPELQGYIGTVGKKLTSSADAGEFPYSFKVVVDKSINAFALPGGPMYIHKSGNRQRRHARDLERVGHQPGCKFSVA